MENKVVLGMLGGMMEEKLLGSDESLEGSETGTLSGRISFLEAAEILGVGPDVMWQWVKLGTFRKAVKAAGKPSKPHRAWTFDRAEVEAIRDSKARINRARMILKRRAVGEIMLHDDDLLKTGDVSMLLGRSNYTIYTDIRDGVIEVERRTSGGQRLIRYGVIRALLEQRDQR